MPNSIRTPKSGTPAHIAKAVDNEEWQKFRVSLKGKPTQEKIDLLNKYWAGEFHDAAEWSVPGEPEAITIRVDNYLKALARGGQIAVTDDYIGALRNHTLVIRR